MWIIDLNMLALVIICEKLLQQLYWDVFFEYLASEVF